VDPLADGDRRDSKRSGRLAVGAAFDEDLDTGFHLSLGQTEFCQLGSCLGFHRGEVRRRVRIFQAEAITMTANSGVLRGRASRSRRTAGGLLGSIGQRRFILRVGMHEFEVIFSKKRMFAPDRRERLGEFDPDRRTITISPKCRPTERRRSLMHEYVHAWQMFYPLPTDEEGFAIVCSTIFEDFARQLDQFGDLLPTFG
jgi:hypothetical protein